MKMRNFHLLSPCKLFKHNRRTSFGSLTCEGICCDRRNYCNGVTRTTRLETQLGTAKPKSAMNFDFQVDNVHWTCHPEEMDIIESPEPPAFVFVLFGGDSILSQLDEGKMEQLCNNVRII